MSSKILRTDCSFNNASLIPALSCHSWVISGFNQLFFSFVSNDWLSLFSILGNLMSCPPSVMISLSNGFRMGKLIRSSDDSLITSSRFCISGPVVIGISSARFDVNRLTISLYLGSVFILSGMVAISVLLKFGLLVLCSGRRNSNGGGFSLISVFLDPLCVSSAFCSFSSSAESSDSCALSSPSDEWYISDCDSSPAVEDLLEGRFVRSGSLGCCPLTSSS